MASGYDSGLYGTATYDGVSVGNPVVELYINGAWVNVTAYVRVADGIVITRGVQDEQSSPASASCRLVVDNTDGRFSPTNTAGAYYGFLTLGTQLRVSVYNTTGALKVRFWGNVYEWPVTWSLGPSDTNRVATLVANGPRRRLLRNPAFLGPYRRASLGRPSPVAYWPLEDAASATTFASGFSGGQAGTFAGANVALASDATWTAAPAGLPKMGDFGSFTFAIPAYVPAAGGVNVSWLMSASVAAGPISIAIQFRTSGAHGFEVDYAPTTDAFSFSMFNQSTGVTEYSSGPTSLGHGQGVQSAVTLLLVQNGTGIDWTLAQYTAADEVGVAMSGTVPSSTLGYLTRADFFNGTGMSTTIGHVFVQAAGVTSLPTGAIDGYAGETAYTRAARISIDENVPLERPVVTSSVFIGPQGAATFVALFDEAANVDGGLSSESVDAYSLYWRGRTTIVGAASRLTLARTMLVVADTTYDDALTTNDVTLTRPNGGSVRATQVTGNRGTTAIGYYSNASDVNVYLDVDLVPQANMALSAGTMDEPRLPALTFDAVTSGVVVSDVTALREGDTVTVTGFLAGSGVGSSRRYLVTGWSETITDCQWVFTVVTQPHPYAYGFTLGSATLGILGTDRLGY